MDQVTVDLYKPLFWCVLTIAVLVLASIVAPRLRKWAWAAINVGFLCALLGLPDVDLVNKLLYREAYSDAASLVLYSRPAVVCGGVVVAWLALQMIGWRRLGKLRILPLTAAGLAVLGLFVLHKLHAATLYESDRAKELLADVGLINARLVPMKSLMLAIGFSYVALRLVEAMRLVYEGRHPAPDLPSTINYLVPFHMLAAGPIQAYADFVAQPAVGPPLTASDALRGIERIAQGLFKKYVLATVIRSLLTVGFSAPSYRVFDILIFYFWLYLDFSGYSDMSVGAGRLMGIATPENFNRPYVARNLIDFWDRWHISLSRFVYRNVFVPVQLALLRRTGPERALRCAAVAFTVSFLLCGLWHELDLPWLLWGAMHAAGLITVNWYRFWLQKHLSREALIRYRNHRGIRLAMIALTQLFAAATLSLASWPNF